MKRYQKLIAMALAAVLCLGIFAGCSSAATPEGMNGTLLEVTNYLRKSEGLKALTYDEALSQKAEKIIALFRQGELNYDPDYGCRLDGTGFDTLMHTEKLYDENDTYHVFGAWGDDYYDDENECWISTGAYLTNTYDSSIEKLPLLQADLTGQIMWLNETNALMDKAAVKVGFATGKIGEEDFWVAIVQKADNADWAGNG